ncbi:ferritin [Amycolatopsis alkalitolerans]|uniref:Ferritin n=1 Tax=Amycolatopsis alkalitolerans TaxID=2547244 RepID=A0A5C4M2Z5_9PSEU|nr:ferritin [Amycolatopsis alkalitolerans]TNC27378.1 ferritin [Amycolatopsis alkalitolerans]
MATKRKEPRSKFYELLQQQIHTEFNASQQYVAIAVWADNSDLPQLAKFFYRQAVEERNHALAITRYLMDTDHHVEIPGTGEIRNDFEKVADLVELALEQERGVTADFRALVKAARDEDDYQGEQFLQWFLAEQIEEVATMTTLRTVVERAEGNLFEIENWLARESVAPGEDASMPAVAGGAL